MKRHRYPIRANLKNSFYFIVERILRLLPTSILMALVFLLISFSLATGYLIRDRDPHDVSVNKPENNVTEQHRFALAAGTSLFDKDLAEKRKIADRLGLPFHMKVEDQRVTMTRLYLGSFPAQTGMIVLENLKSFSAGAFSVKQGQTVSIYGGSFYYPKEASRLKDLLIQKGFSLKEIPTRVTLPVYAAFIGDFDTFHEADAFRRSSAGFTGEEMTVVEIR
ncbi:SPOR domain-containing protein [Thermodesulfobacteriota bacterium]